MIESFARKTPVIVRDVGPLPQHVRDSEGGFIFQSDAELVDAVHRIGTEPSLRARLGENGYRRFVQEWSREAHLARYFDILRETAIKKLGRVPWEA